MDTEAEFILTLQNSSEIIDLQKKSENAMKKYQRTRPQPSAESIRRTKREFRQIMPAIHPFFLKRNFLNVGNEQGKDISCLTVEPDVALLHKLREWRPNATIFELNKGGKDLSNIVMKSKRKAHQISISKNDNSVEIHPFIDESTNGAAKQNSELTHIDYINEIATTSKFNLGTQDNILFKKPKKRGAELKREQEKLKHFVPYQPDDARVESALAVERNNFDAQARNCSVDISADDDKGLYMEQKQKKWDRKRKKFVSTDDGSRVKRIRAEDGSWLPASYKSGRYEQWKKKSNFSSQHNRGDTEENENIGRSYVPKFSVNRVRNTRKDGQKSGVKSSHGALKNPQQIMKSRRKKAGVEAYQTYRRNENSKRKSNRGSQGRK